MYVIGERINGMFTAIGDALIAKDKKPVQNMAAQQIENGADALDINVGTRVPKAERAAAIKWLVEATREVTDKPLAIDNPGLDTMRVGLQAAGKGGRAAAVYEGCRGPASAVATEVRTKIVSPATPSRKRGAKKRTTTSRR